MLPEELVQAIKNNDYPSFCRLIRSCPPEVLYTEQDQEGNTVFECAIKYNNPDITKHIVDIKIANMINKKRWDDLDLITTVRNPQGLKVLLESIPPDEVIEFAEYKNESGWTSLHLIAKRGSLEMMRIFFGKIPPDTLIMLAENKNEGGFTPLHLVLYNPIMNVDTLRFFLQICSLNVITQPDSEGKTAEMMAIERGKPELAALIHSKIEEFRTLRELIEHNRFEEALGFIATNHINPNIKIDEFGATILTYALENYKREETPELLRFIAAMLRLPGVNVNEPDLQGETPLIIAVENNYTRAIDLLLDHGADINRPGSNRQTPLHVAACAINLPLIAKLLQRGANRTARDSDGKTARDWLHIPEAQKVALFGNPGRRIHGHANPFRGAMAATATSAVPPPEL